MGSNPTLSAISLFPLLVSLNIMSQAKSKTHVFDPAHRERLCSAERKTRLPAGEILTFIGLKSGEAFVDIGSGTGFFSLPAAAQVGPKGKVFSLDIAPDMISDLKAAAARAGLANIEAAVSTEAKLGLPSGAAFYFMANVFHEIADKPAFLAAIRKAMGPRSLFVIIDYERRPTEHGPPLEERVSPEEARELVERQGFSVRRVWTVNAEEYGLIAGLRPEE